MMVVGCAALALIFGLDQIKHSFRSFRCLINNNTIIYSNSTLGNFCNISANVSIAPNSNIQENCFIGFSSIIASNVIIEKNSYIGMRSSVLESIKINQGSRVLPNTLVHRNFNKNKAIIFGDPAKVIGIENN